MATTKRYDPLDPALGNPLDSHVRATNTPEQRAAATRAIVHLFETGQETAEDAKRFLLMLGLADESGLIVVDTAPEPAPPPAAGRRKPHRRVR